MDPLKTPFFKWTETFPNKWPDVASWAKDISQDDIPFALSERNLKPTRVKVVTKADELRTFVDSLLKKRVNDAGVEVLNQPVIFMDIEFYQSKKRMDGQSERKSSHGLRTSWSRASVVAFYLPKIRKVAVIDCVEFETREQCPCGQLMEPLFASEVEIITYGGDYQDTEALYGVGVPNPRVKDLYPHVERFVQRGSVQTIAHPQLRGCTKSKCGLQSFTWNVTGHTLSKDENIRVFNW
eukprot:GHVU01181913.1.p1 GENE.GHVU01181913.1~~GHVU01181913.1.p1  ORF type:complete len:238 (-),score=17.12 GHVU01181913.1:309-1022(-)